jgi:hypothetical protein
VFLRFLKIYSANPDYFKGSVSCWQKIFLNFSASKAGCHVGLKGSKSAHFDRLKLCTSEKAQIMPILTGANHAGHVTLVGNFQGSRNLKPKFPKSADFDRLKLCTSGEVQIMPILTGSNHADHVTLMEIFKVQETLSQNLQKARILTGSSYAHLKRLKSCLF